MPRKDVACQLFHWAEVGVIILWGFNACHLDLGIA